MTKIVFIGAGLLQFGTCMRGDILNSGHLCNVDIVSNDSNNAAAKRTASVAHEFIKAHYLQQALHFESDSRLALLCADFGMISIEV